MPSIKEPDTKDDDKDIDNEPVPLITLEQERQLL